MITWQVPLAGIDLGEDEITAVTNVLRSRWLSMGSVTAEFERRFAEYIGVQYAFAVTNCTAALHLAHLALGAGPGDTVICPSLTFVATANAIRYTGATPVFADITSPNDLNISPADIEAKIDATTKGICVVHYGGYACDMESIMRIARRHHLYVVEDAAHAPGASCWLSNSAQTPAQHPPGATAFKVQKKCGSIGDIGCFSFFSNKNMTTGEGGMITTNSAVLAEKIKLLRSHSMTSLSWDRNRGHSFSYDVVEPGYNYRIDEIRAAIGLTQLGKLEDNNQKRSELTDIYKENLIDIDAIHIPFFSTQSVSSHHLFPIILSRKNCDDQRDQFMTFMREKGIQTSIHYPPVHQFAHYNSYSDKCILNLTDDIAKRVVTLPLYPTMSKEQINHIIGSITEWAVATKRH